MILLRLHVLHRLTLSQVSLILTKPELFAEWKRDITTMSSRIIEMRDRLFNKLQELKTPAPAGRSDWGHIKSQIVRISLHDIVPRLYRFRCRVCSRSPVSPRLSATRSSTITRSTLLVSILSIHSTVSGMTDLVFSSFPISQRSNQYGWTEYQQPRSIRRMC